MMRPRFARQTPERPCDAGRVPSASRLRENLDPALATN
jgi:hypothetical protein